MRWGEGISKNLKIWDFFLYPEYGLDLSRVVITSPFGPGPTDIKTLHEDLLNTILLIW